MEKKQIKLYTEEQVIQMIEKSRETFLTAEFLILTTPSIELPTDKEIEKVAEKTLSVNFLSFIEGAKWMLTQIKN